MNKIREKAAVLWQGAEYREVVAAVASLVPLIPRFDYKNQSNIEEIKFKLAQKEMHETVMRLLKPEVL